jgi:hypothetical protein
MSSNTGVRLELQDFSCLLLRRLRVRSVEAHSRAPPPQSSV